jgi:hypothetical protein
MSTEYGKTTRGIEAPNYDDLIHGLPLWNEIAPNLFQGGTHDHDIIGDRTYAKPFTRQEAFITSEQFDTVVTLYQYANPAGWFVREMRYCVYDAGIDRIDIDELFATVEFAYSEWKRGKRVLIRCQAGLNRSSLVTALVLMEDGMSARDAIDLIRAKRSKDCLFNEDFERWLLQFDEVNAATAEEISE